MTDAHRPIFGSASIAETYHRYLEPVIFGPWAARLVDYVGISEGQKVLDVATGTGAVARAAARRVGPSGRVLASDVSPEMLAEAVLAELGDDPPLEALECPATELALPDASVEVALCQQGFQFIGDRGAAVAEMRRVLRPGGRVGVAVWLAGRRLEPFDTYAEVLAANEVPEPFPDAYDRARSRMSPEELAQCLTDGGLREVEVVTEELVVQWPSPQAAAHGVGGAPFAAGLERLEPARLEGILAALTRAMTGDDGRPVAPTMAAVLGRAVA